MGDELANLPAGLHVPAAQSRSRHFNKVDIITPAMHAILNQIIHCPYQAGVRRLFLEGKTMELAALKLDQLKLCCPGKVSALKSDNLDRITQVRSILADNFQAPRICPCFPGGWACPGLNCSRLLRRLMTQHRQDMSATCAWKLEGSYWKAER